MSLPTLALKPKRDKAILNRHPWIFSGAVQQLPAVPAGSIVRVADATSKTLGLAFFDPASQIVGRMFAFGDHDTEPTKEFWQSRFADAYQLRQTYITKAYDNTSGSSTDTYRLIHAEGDELPGIVADVYGGRVVVLQLRTPATNQRLALWVELLQGLGFGHIYLKNKSYDGTGAPAVGENGWQLGGPETADFGDLIGLEHGLKFHIDVVNGQKTGFFIDQRENRHLLRHLAAGKSVLNAFAYSGGFSVAALAGGATKVVSVDISKDACALAEGNVSLNFGQEVNHEAIAQDCFAYLKQQPQDWDIVVLDPPAFAKNVRAVNNAARGYKELNMQGMRCAKPGGLLFTYSCSQLIDRDLFRKIVFGAAADIGRPVRILHQMTQPLDHPISIYHPEGEYLKGLVLQIL